MAGCGSKKGDAFVLALTQRAIVDPDIFSFSGSLCRIAEANHSGIFALVVFASYYCDWTAIVVLSGSIFKPVVMLLNGHADRRTIT